MITLCIVVGIIMLVLAQYKVMQEDKAIQKHGWSYSRDSRDTARTIRTGAILAVIALIIVRGPLNDFYAELEAKNTAYMKNTFLGEMYVKDYYLDSNGDSSDFHGRVPMCSKCGHTVGSWSNPAHGHKLVTRTHPEKGMGLGIFPAELEDRYVRICPMDN